MKSIQFHNIHIMHKVHCHIWYVLQRILHIEVSTNRCGRSCRSKHSSSREFPARAIAKPQRSQTYTHKNDTFPSPHHLPFSWLHFQDSALQLVSPGEPTGKFRGRHNVTNVNGKDWRMVWFGIQLLFAWNFSRLRFSFCLDWCKYYLGCCYLISHVNLQS